MFALLKAFNSNDLSGAVFMALINSLSLTKLFRLTLYLGSPTEKAFQCGCFVFELAKVGQPTF